MELWTLRALTRSPCEVHVVAGRSGRATSLPRRLIVLVRRHGVFATASRLLANKLIAGREMEREQRELEALLDGPTLRSWWQRDGPPVEEVPHLNDPASAAAVAAHDPALIVRVSGGILRPEIFKLARVATLNIHHGMAPDIRGMWSIPWGLVEGRADWIGATLHVIDEGIDTGAVVWRGGPQIAPGDTATTLLLRAHIAVVDALARCVAACAAGAPDALAPASLAPAVSSYRSAPGLAAWLRLLRGGRGTRLPVTVDAALR